MEGVIYKGGDFSCHIYERSEPKPSLNIKIAGIELSHLKSIEYEKEIEDAKYNLLVYTGPSNTKWILKHGNSEGQVYYQLYEDEYKKIGITKENVAHRLTDLPNPEVQELMKVAGRGSAEVFIAPYFDYPNLSEILRDIPLNEQAAQKLITNISTAVDNMAEKLEKCKQERGPVGSCIYHEDLNDTNILINPMTFEVYLIDFDILSTAKPVKQLSDLKQSIENKVGNFKESLLDAARIKYL